jgi:urease accessory protein
MRAVPAPFLAAALLLLLAPAGAEAHLLGAHGAGLEQGLAHPFAGIDHLLAMVAVGLWAAQRGGRALWAVPLAFVAMMAAGGALGLAGATLPLVETGIAGSLVVLGLIVALSLRLPLATAMAVVGVFAVFHGHAHGTELPEAAAPLGYAAGFVLATAALHGLGIAAGLALRRPAGRALVRASGAGVALAGLALAFLA